MRIRYLTRGFGGTLLAGACVYLMVLLDRVDVSTHGTLVNLATFAAIMILYAGVVAGLNVFVHFLFMLSEPIQNIAENRRQWHALMFAGKPYAVYLRNDDLEKRSAYDRPMRSPDGPLGSGGMFIPRIWSSLENSIVQGLRIPVFTLADAADDAIGDGLRLNVSPGAHWTDEVARVATDAALIVVNVHALTPGVLSALRWLSANGAAERTLLVIAADAVPGLRAQLPGFIDSVAGAVVRPAGEGRHASIVLPEVLLTRWGRLTDMPEGLRGGTAVPSKQRAQLG
jgi:hypothetical protein